MITAPPVPKQSESKPALAWTALAKHVYQSLTAAQQRAILQEIETVEPTLLSGSPSKYLPLSNPRLYVLPVHSDLIRVILKLCDSGWTVTDIVRPTGGFKFAKLSPTVP